MYYYFASSTQEKNQRIKAPELSTSLTAEEEKELQAVHESWLHVFRALHA